jgi:NAD(P)-dependent dehydrogenase (short-subunit alcohol dehydrogenase family)
MSDWHFDGKVAIVTGGASGIGFACSVTLARGGARVVIADINEESGNRAVSGITREGGQATFTRTDVGRHEDVEAMVEAAGIRKAGHPGKLSRPRLYSYSLDFEGEGRIDPGGCRRHAPDWADG